MKLRQEKPPGGQAHKEEAEHTGAAASVVADEVIQSNPPHDKQPEKQAGKGYRAKIQE